MLILSNFSDWILDELTYTQEPKYACRDQVGRNIVAIPVDEGFHTRSNNHLRLTNTDIKLVLGVKLAANINQLIRQYNSPFWVHSLSC